MSLSRYIREDQEFLIYLRSPGGAWQRYDSNKDGPAGDIKQNYVVAYLNGEVLDVVPSHLSSKIPEGLHLIKTYPPQNISMPDCAGNDPRVSITHIVSSYHNGGKYATRIQNTGQQRFRIRRFGGFRRSGILGRWKMSTIANNWFTDEQFRCWYNQKKEWIMPGEYVIDYDNYGYGGYWIFEVEFDDRTIFVKSKEPGCARSPTTVIPLCIHPRGLPFVVLVGLIILLGIAKIIFGQKNDVFFNIFLGALIYFVLFSLCLNVWQARNGRFGISGSSDSDSPDVRNGPSMNPVPAPLEPSPSELKAAAEVAIPQAESPDTPRARENGG